MLALLLFAECLSVYCLRCCCVDLSLHYLKAPPKGAAEYLVNHADIKSKYDAIVVGAGHNGLVSVRTIKMFFRMFSEAKEN